MEITPELIAELVKALREGQGGYMKPDEKYLELAAENPLASEMQHLNEYALARGLENSQTPMPLGTRALGQDRFGTIIGQTSPLEYIAATAKQIQGQGQEATALQSMYANLLRRKKFGELALQADDQRRAAEAQARLAKKPQVPEEPIVGPMELTHGWNGVP